jgi:peroxiredoxin
MRKPSAQRPATQGKVSTPLCGLGVSALLGTALALCLLGGRERGARAAGMDQAHRHSALAVGQQAPDFVAQDAHGTTFTLQDYRGRPVLLNFWATWCAPCRLELPELQAMYEAHKEKGLVILAVNQDEAGQKDVVRAYVATQGFTFPALLDPQGSVAADYQVILLPSTIFIDVNGAVVATHFGPLTRPQIERYLAMIMPS